MKLSYIQMYDISTTMYLIKKSDHNSLKINILFNKIADMTF